MAADTGCMTRLVLLVLFAIAASACADVPPPPYDMVFHGPVSDYEKQQWHTAGAAWNAVVGTAVFVEHVGRECGHVIVVYRPEADRGEAFRDHCNITIVFAAEGDKGMRLHELGHALMSGTDADHRAGSVMEHDGSGAQELSPEDGAAVRAYWGLPPLTPDST